MEYLINFNNKNLIDDLETISKDREDAVEFFENITNEMIYEHIANYVDALANGDEKTRKILLAAYSQAALTAVAWISNHDWETMPYCYTE